MILRGRHISLRPPLMADAELMYRWENDAQVAAISSHGGDITLDQMKSFIADIKDIYLDQQLRYVICQDEQPIGTIDLFEYDQGAKQVSLGILIADKSLRRQGLGAEAIDLLANHAFDSLGIDCIRADVQSDNSTSLAFFEAQGFTATSSEAGITTFEKRSKA